MAKQLDIFQTSYTESLEQAHGEIKERGCAREYCNDVGVAVEAKNNDGDSEEGIKRPPKQLHIAQVLPLHHNFGTPDHDHYCCVHEANHLQRAQHRLSHSFPFSESSSVQAAQSAMLDRQSGYP